MKVIKKHNIIFTGLATGLVFIAILAFTNTDFKSISSKLQTKNYENRIIDIYQNYIEDIDVPGVTLKFPAEQGEFVENQEYLNSSQLENELYFFPITLWQIYSLKGEEAWKTLAEDYTEVLLKHHIPVFTNEENLHRELLFSYINNGSQQYKDQLLTIFLSGFNDQNNYPDCINQNLCKHSFDRYFETQLLLHATKETGDPYFRNLAYQNTENIFKGYFLNNSHNELFYGIANWQRTPSMSELAELTSEEFYYLSVSFYAFTLFEKETGILKYNALTNNMAKVFDQVFNEIQKEASDVSVKRYEVLMRIDRLSKVFICLALDNMKPDMHMNKKALTKDLFYSIVDDLENSALSDDYSYNFKTFYYLFEYLIQQES